MDLISDLPDPILQHILSFLPIKLIVQTTVLSKRWSHVWATFPALEFDRTFFELTETNQSQQLINFVEQTLRQLTGLKKFKLHIDFPGPKSATVVDRWLDYVLERNVLELEVVVTVENGRRYNLPQRVFASKSLAVLTLGDCRLCSTSPPLDGLKLLAMRKLCLLGVYAEDEIVKRLVSNCPLIQHITLHSCLGLRSLWLCKASELITMEIQNNSGLYELGIKAMKLQSFDFRGQFQPCSINISLCQNLRTLKLSMVAISDDWLHDTLSKLPLLEILALYDCHMLESLRISSPHLKKFILCGCESLTTVEVDAPRLSAFEFSGDAVSFSLNAPTLSRADIELNPRVFDNPWIVKQIEFLAQFNHLKAFTLQNRTGKTVIIPEELRQTFPSPLYGVKHLKLKIQKPLFSPCIQDLVKGLLWISPQPETISIESGFGNKLLRQTVGGVHDHCHCACLPISCWRHCLKELKLENIREEEERKNLKMFFSENAKSSNI